MPGLENFLGQKRAEAIAGQIAPFIGSQALVADIGAGDCRVSKAVSRRVGNVIPFDILDTNVTGMDLTLYDGNTLPLDDSVVDASLLVFVLHHAADESRLFEEARRITKPSGQLIVIEDTPQGLVQTSLWRLIHERQHKRNPNLLEAHELRTIAEWRIFF